jgi:phage-related tail protein
MRIILSAIAVLILLNGVGYLSNAESAGTRARRLRAEESERYQQAERDKAQVRLREAEADTQQKVDLIHEVVARARAELTAAQ